MAVQWASLDCPGLENGIIGTLMSEGFNSLIVTVFLKIDMSPLKDGTELTTLNCVAAA